MKNSPVQSHVLRLAHPPIIPMWTVGIGAQFENLGELVKNTIFVA